MATLPEILNWLLLVPFCAAAVWLLREAALIGDEQRVLQGAKDMVPVAVSRRPVTWLRASATPPRYR